jgi:hypothetical protein
MLRQLRLPASEDPRNKASLAGQLSFGLSETPPYFIDRSSRVHPQAERIRMALEGI